MCKVFNISRSGYYKWYNRDKKESKIQVHGIEIRKVFNQSQGTYGSPRVTHELQQKGIDVSRSTVARSMFNQKLMARPKRKFIHTTDSKHGLQVFPNLLNRDFTSTEVNQKWVSDITYIRTTKGWAYLTTVLDLADRMIISWTVSDDLSTKKTTLAAMKIALERRKPKGELLFHSDRGIQYCAVEFRQFLRQGNTIITQSMSRKGNCWDNAVAESFFKTLKIEFIKDKTFKNLEEAKFEIFNYIERWYNTQRKHSAIGYLSPLQMFYKLNS